MKKKVGICGHLAENKKKIDGQTIKTKNFTEEIKKKYNKEEIIILDTYNWNERKISFLIECVKLAVTCENIIFFPASRGVKVFVPLFAMLGFIFKCKTHYVVIGSWLKNVVEKNIFLSFWLRKINFIYVETNSLILELESRGFFNVCKLNNFKNIEKYDFEELPFEYDKPYPVCIFSRIIKQKGIEDAITNIIRINNEQKKEVYTLDIYGPIDENYEKEFIEILDRVPEYIKYKGIISPEKSSSVIKEYFLLLFPTLFSTEGIPGTIIDSYAAGVPVLSAKWNSAEEIIEDYKTGILFEQGNTDDFYKKLQKAMLNPEEIFNMKKKCLEKSQEYLPSENIEIIFKNFT